MSTMSSSSTCGKPALRTRNAGERERRRVRFGTIEELETRELLASLICDVPAGTWAGENSDLPFKRWCPDLQFSSPSSLALADFNNDSTLDLAVGTDDPTQNLSVLISRGDGTFASMRRTGEPGRAVSIAAEDFDRDGLADLIESNETTEFVSVFRQRPDGTFEGPFGARFNNVRAVTTTGVLDCGPRGQVAIAHDFDTGSPNGIVRLACVDNLYPGGIHFGMVPIWAEVNPGPRALVAGDFIPGLGSQEVLAVNGSGTVQVVGYNGAVPSAWATIPVGGPLTATAADFDSDGRLDAAIATGQSISILLNRSELQVHAELQGIGAHAVASADLDGDGHADLIAAGWQYQLVGDESGYFHVYTDTLWLISGRGDGTFADPVTIELGETVIPDEEHNGYNGPSALAGADFNGDGSPDLAIANPGQGIVTILVNQSATDGRDPPQDDGDDSTDDSCRLLEPARVIPASDEPITMDDGDFNQDGNVDLVVVKRSTRVLSVLLGQGDGNFIHGLDLAPATGVTVGDFDNDRIPDIAAGMLQGPSNVGPGFVTVFLGNGDATFDPGIQVMESVVSMHSLVSADFNRDGNLDLAGTDYYAGRVAVALGNGDGSFGQAQTFGAGATGLVSLIAADLNADDVPDLAVSSRDNQRFSILYGDGTGALGQPATYDAGAALEYLTAGDFNRDGQPDLAASMYTTVGLSILLSDGMGSFLPPRQLDVGYRVANLAAVDINGDGDLDLVFGVARPDRTVAILLGQGDGTFGQPIAYEPEREDSEHAGIVVADFNNDTLPDVAVPARYDSVFVFLHTGGCNEPPIAHDAGELTDEDAPLAITLAGTDLEGGEVTYAIMDRPQHGTLSEFDPATGAVMYTPEADWHGLDTFTFIVNDGEQDSEPATVYVRVDPLNDEPVFTPPGEQPIEVPKNTTATFDLCEWFRDIETPCEELIFEAFASVGAVEWLDSHTMRFVPEAGYHGPVELSLTVNDTGDVPGADADGDGVEDCDILSDPDCELYSAPITVGPIEVEIDVINRAPQTLDQQVTVREDGSIVIALDANDPDGDELSFYIVAEPEHGCWEQDGEAGQSILYRPHAGYVGSDSFTFYVNDGELDSEMATVTIEVTPLVTGFTFDSGVLTVIGTPGDDSIRVVRSGRGFNVLSNFGTFNVPNRSAVVSMVVRGRDGNDTINAAALAASQIAEIHGGSGNDRITSGAGHDLLLGDDGNDIVTGGSGDDLLIGGAGSDRLVGSTGSDLLLGGVLYDPCRDLDLRAVLVEWRAGTSADDKLAAAQPLIDLMLDDSTLDILTGGLGIDLFAMHRLDRIIDRTAADLVIVL